MCLQAFSAATKLSVETIHRHAHDVAATTAPDIYNTVKSTNRSGKYGIQRVVVKAILINVANEFQMECSRGRGCKEESPIPFFHHNSRRGSCTRNAYLSGAIFVLL